MIFLTQALLSDLPPELEEMDFNHTLPEPDDTSFSVSSLSEKNASESLWFERGNMIQPFGCPSRCAFQDNCIVTPEFFSWKNILLKPTNSVKDEQDIMAIVQKMYVKCKSIVWKFFPKCWNSGKKMYLIEQSSYVMHNV